MSTASTAATLETTNAGFRLQVPPATLLPHFISSFLLLCSSLLRVSPPPARGRLCGGRSLGRAAAGVAPSADALFPLSLCCSSPYLPPRLVAHFWNCFACEERCRHTASAAIDALEWQGPLVPLPVTAILLNVSVGLLDCLLPLGLRVFCRHLEVVGGATPLVLKLSSSRHLKSESQAYPSSAPFRTFACGVIGNATKGAAQAV